MHSFGRFKGSFPLPHPFASPKLLSPFHFYVAFLGLDLKEQGIMVCNLNLNLVFNLLADLESTKFMFVLL